jgi:hypothetical protein
MVYAAIDIHKAVFQAAPLDAGSGEVRDARFPATREALQHWAMPLCDKGDAVAIEAMSWQRRGLLQRLTGVNQREGVRAPAPATSTLVLDTPS